MPMAITADLDQWETCQPSVCDQGAVCLLQMCNDLIKQTCHNAPLSLFPFLLPWHHRPGHRSRPANEPANPHTQSSHQREMVYNPARSASVSPARRVTPVLKTAPRCC